MNWKDVLPYTVARNQIGWERRHRLLTAYLTGAVTRKELASRLGVSVGMISVIINKAVRGREQKRLSPVEKYFQIPTEAISREMTPAEFRERLYDVADRARRPKPKPEPDPNPPPLWAPPSPRYDSESGSWMAWDCGTNRYVPLWRMRKTQNLN